MSRILERHGTTEEKGDGHKTYTPNDPEHLLYCVVDHLGLCLPKPGATKKEEMDAISAYAVTLRERCGLSIVMLQQENRNSTSMDRRKADMTECSSEDLKDTGNSYNDGEICIGVYFPLKHKLKNCHGYPIIVEDQSADFQGLRDTYRGLCLIKNRKGESDKYDNVSFYGQIGLFKELPKAEEITDFSAYTQLRKEPVKAKDTTPSRPKEPITFSF